VTTSGWTPSNDRAIAAALDRRREERSALLRLADELEDLALRTDAEGRVDGPGLRADAAVLRRVADDRGQPLLISSAAYDGPLTTVGPAQR
jgi:uncharacterized protein YjiS (DUF1127 family)